MNEPQNVVSRLMRVQKAMARTRRMVGRLNQARSDLITYRRILEAARHSDQGFFRSKESEASGTIVFTTHKSASTLMMQVLRQIAVLSWANYFDYERCLWRNGDRLPIPDHEQFLTAHVGRLFCGKKEIYGPIRYPIPVNQSEQGQVQALFFLRDPRDVLVSAFHSFGYLHPVPSNPSHAATFLEERARIQAEGLDAFVMRKAEQWMIPTLSGFRLIRDRSVQTHTIHYQTFFDDPVKVAMSLLDALGVTQHEIREEIIAFLGQQRPYLGSSVTHRSNPAHIRSGANRQFESTLAPEAVRALTKMLEEELTSWGFAL